MILIIACSESIYSQVVREDFTDYKLQSSKDTIIVRNHVGKWWFGPLVGLNCEFNYNTLTTLKYPGYPDNPFNTKLNFTGGQDFGWFSGALVEYMPPGKLLSYGTRVYFPDIRVSSSEITQKLDSTDYKYQYTGTYKYISLVPFIKYNFPIEGLYATLGLNLDLPYANQASLIHLRLDSSFITHNFKLTHEQMKIRYGAELGVGWEFTVSDINDKVRVRFDPYLTASVGSKILADLNSKWNNIVVKLGFAIKFCLNETTIDTLKYNIESETLPEVYALVTTPQQVSFEVSGNLASSLPAYELALVNREEPYVQIALEGSMSRINSGTTINPVSELPGAVPAGFGEGNIPVEPVENKKQEEVLKLEFGENNAKTLIYSKNKDTKLNEEMKSYLDKIISYSKMKTIREIYIFGYTEELGSRQKNLDISRQRADAAYKYLINAGVGKKTKIYKDGRGALIPKKEAAKREDVKLNNRIEIIIK